MDKSDKSLWKKSSEDLRRYLNEIDETWEGGCDLSQQYWDDMRTSWIIIHILKTRHRLATYWKKLTYGYQETFLTF